jgi:hypothetical protein
MLVEQGDTDRVWTFGVKRGGRAWEIPPGYAFTLRMAPLEGGAIKIDDAACTYNAGDTFITYSPTDTDVDTPGIFRAQLFANTTPSAKKLRFSEFEITIEQNVDGVGDLPTPDPGPGWSGLTSDAEHGARGVLLGPTPLHSLATTSAPGFMSAADKVAHDTLVAGDPIAAAAAAMSAATAAAEAADNARSVADDAASAIATHAARTDNPHAVTAAQVGAVQKSGDTMSGDLALGGHRVTGAAQVQATPGTFAYSASPSLDVSTHNDWEMPVGLVTGDMAMALENGARGMQGTISGKMDGSAHTLSVTATGWTVVVMGTMPSTASKHWTLGYLFARINGVDTLFIYPNPQP